MSIKAIAPKDIPGRSGYKDCKIQSDIFEFQQSDWPACEVEVEGYKSASTARNAYVTAAERLGVNVSVISRQNRLFLIRNAENNQ